MSGTLVVVNPNAANGYLQRIGFDLESKLAEYLGDVDIAITRDAREVNDLVNKAYAEGLRRVISIGGDGTNHSLINALANFSQDDGATNPIAYGILPVGTGKDWARTINVPFDMDEALTWIENAQPHPVDLGKLKIDTGEEHFLNIASAGISGDIVDRIESSSSRHEWIYLSTTVQSLLTYRPKYMRIELDGELWYEGETYALAVANGKSFGRGMKIAPEAEIDDGWFDVVLIKGMSAFRAMLALRLVYSGKHLDHPMVESKRAKHVRILDLKQPTSLELDGELAIAQEIEFSIRPHAIQMLLQK